MAVQSHAWERVGEKFETLGEHLRGHFDDVSAEAAAERAAFEKSVRGLLDALEDGFSGAGRAVRDPMLRQDVTSVAAAVREALLDTFETAGGQVRERLSRPRRTTPPAAKRATAGRKTTTGSAAAKPAAGKTSARRRDAT